MIDASIVLCSYNRPDMLAEAARSILALDVHEIIIVDDCSTNPDVKKAIYEIQKHDQRVMVHYKPTNGGESAALNTGIRVATGEWIIPLHDDDRRLPATATMIEWACSNAYEVVWGDVQTIDVRGQVVGIEKGNVPDFDHCWQEDYFAFPAMAWRREIHARIGWFDETLRSNLDWDFKLRCVKECRCGYYPFPVVEYRRHPKNKSTINAGRIMKRCEAALKAKIAGRYGL